MSIFSFLSGGRRNTTITPTIKAVVAPTQEQFNVGYRSALTSGVLGRYVDPYRAHSPIPVESYPTKHETIERAQDSALQQYFFQKTLLPTVDVAIPAHGVHTNPQVFSRVDHEKYGGFVPFDGIPALIQPSHTPIILLSTPINVTTNVLANGRPDLEVPNPPLNIVPWADRKVPRKLNYGK